MKRAKFVRICYTSRPAPGVVAEQEVEPILAASRRNNARCGVTGALIFNRGTFGQILEGIEDAVDETFARIENDPRHGEMEILGLKTIDAPAFADWSMGFVGRPSSLKDPRAEEHRTTLDVALMGGDEVFATLRRILWGRDAALRIG